MRISLDPLADGGATTFVSSDVRPAKARARRILLFPNTDTLSHLTRALTLAEWLEVEGFEVHIAMSRERTPWALPYAKRCHAVRELWEPSGVPFPCLKWFADRDYVESCIDSQEEVLRQVRPDLVVGIFDFVASTAVRDVPYLSINGACMLPSFPGVLGFDPSSNGDGKVQRKLFESFWRFAGKAFSGARQARGLPEALLATELLLGDTNLIYEIPEVFGEDPLPSNCVPIGPIFWSGWEKLGAEVPWSRDSRRPIVYVNSGSLPGQDTLRDQILGQCLASGARVLLSTGTGGAVEDSSNVLARPLLRPAEAASVADVVVCTGGVGACYANMLHGVPSLVLPTQPEQATNGINLERAGCGRVLMANVPFSGNYADYAKALDLGAFSSLLREMLASGRDGGGLGRISGLLRGCRTRELFLRSVRALL